MKKLPHEIVGMDSIRDGSWKKDPRINYKPPWHWSRRIKSFLGIHLPMCYRFDIRELFIQSKDFEGDFDYPSYKLCWKRFKEMIL